jgi:hypothetical protein
MRILYNFIGLLVLGTVLLKAGAPVVLETKVIDKSFNVNSNADLEINNRYGNITMETWDKNIVQIHVEIKVDGKDSEAVKNRINAINVEFSANPSLVSAVTKITDTRHSNKTNIEIHYTVKLPKSNNIDIVNRYGNIYLDELNGSSKIDLSYGSMSLGKLNNNLNNWNLDYISNSKVDYVKSAIVNSDYSHLEISKAEILNLNVDYTDVKIGNVNDLINVMGYGNLIISSVSRVSNTADYTNVKIGTLTNSFVSTGDYGGISIDRIKAGFDKIIVSADYSSLNLGMDSGAGYTIKGEFKYAGMKYPANVNMSKVIEKNTSSTYEGKAGNGSGKIEIQMDYGGAKIKIN